MLDIVYRNTACPGVLGKRPLAAIILHGVELQNSNGLKNFSAESIG
jgi:hypothetical protein